MMFLNWECPAILSFLDRSSGRWCFSMAARQHRLRADPAVS
jgi:hypothetical protein